MACIKTGARIYFENYGCLVPGDLYKVGSSMIIRWNNQGIQYNANSNDATHFVESVGNSELWWHREDLGVTVLPADWVIEL